MARKIRSDAKLGNVENKLGIGNSVTNPGTGRNRRSDAKLGTLRKEEAKRQENKRK